MAMIPGKEGQGSTHNHICQVPLPGSSIGRRFANTLCHGEHVSSLSYHTLYSEDDGHTHGLLFQRDHALMPSLYG